MTRSCRVAQSAEIHARGKAWMDCVVATLCTANSVRAAGIIRPGVGGVVAALAINPPDGMDWREIHHVEAHRSDCWQPCDYVIKRTVASDVATLRAREQLVPACETGSATLYLNGKVR